MEISDQALSIVIDVISIGTPMAALAYNEGRVKQQISSMNESIQELKKLFYIHISKD